MTTTRSGLFVGTRDARALVPPAPPALLRRLVPARRPRRAAARSTARCPGSACNRAAPVSFHDADHGPRDGSPLRPWIESRLAEAGVDLEGGAVRILTFPRVFGYVFNPISVWFCHGPRRRSARDPLRGVEHVRGMARLPGARSPGDEVGNASGPAACAPSSTRSCSSRRSSTWPRRTTSRRACPTSGSRSWCGRPRPAAGCWWPRSAHAAGRSPGARSHRCCCATRSSPLKVVGGIHWEALKLWRKGAPYRRRGSAARLPDHHRGRGERPARTPSGAPRCGVRSRDERARGRRRTAHPRHRGPAHPRRTASRSRCPTAPTRTFEGRHAGPTADVTLHRWRPLRLVTTTGAIGLADAYVRGDYDVDDLEAFLELCAMHLEPAYREPVPDVAASRSDARRGGCSGAPAAPGVRSPTSCSTTTSATTSTRRGSTSR